MFRRQSMRARTALRRSFSPSFSFLRPGGRLSAERLLELRHGLTKRLFLEPLEDRRLLAADLDTNLTIFEPHVAVSPTNPAVIAASQFNQIVLSTNFGQTFGAPINATLPAALAAANYGFGGDSVLAFNAQGALFWSYLAVLDSDGDGNNEDQTVIVQRVNPLTGAQVGNSVDLSPGNFADDKQWIAIDDNLASPFFGNVYVAWPRLDGSPDQMLFSRSIDGGVTFSAPALISDPDGPNNLPGFGDDEEFVWPVHVETAANGDLYVAYHIDQDNGDQGDDPNGGPIVVLRSSNGGVDFAAGTVIQKTTAFPAGTSQINDNTQTDGTTIAGTDFWMQGAFAPYVLTDPVRPGRIYVIGNDDPNNQFGNGDEGDVVMTISNDNGLTWSAAQTISHGPAGTLQVFPIATIDELGNIAVFWYDTRAGLTNAGGNFLLDLFATVSRDGGATFSNDFRVNDVRFDPDLNAPVRFNGPPATTRIGEYNGIAASQGVVHLVWTGNDGPGAGAQQEIFYDQFNILGPFADRFEENDSLPTATILGSEPKITLNDVTLDNPVDVDFYKFTAPSTGRLTVNAFFSDSVANLRLRVFDSDGLVDPPIALGAATQAVAGLDVEGFVIPVVADEEYWLEVSYDPTELIHNPLVYDLEIENFAAPAPTFVDLVPASDTGVFNNDDVTTDTTPTILIQADLTKFAASGVTLLNQALIDPNNDGEADDATDDGAGVYVSFVNLATGVVADGFANRVGASNVLWTFTSAALTAGEYFVSSAVQIVDGQQDPARATGRALLSEPLFVTIEIVVPPVSFGQPGGTDGLAASSDSGLPTQPASFADRITNDSTPSFFGLAEAQATIRLYADVNGNNLVDLGVDQFLGQTTALPFGQNPLFADGFWQIESIADLNNPAFFPTRDGLRRIMVTAQDITGNVNQVNDGVGDAEQSLDVFLDTQGPRITDVVIPGFPDLDIFAPKPHLDGPTPLIDRLTINVTDLPNRLAPDFLYTAIDAAIADVTGNYQLIGDANGLIAIQDVIVTLDPPVTGQPATASITLVFANPLPDDRYTLIVLDAIVDPAGNRLDGESNADEPNAPPVFPSGDGVVTGVFVSRFTVDAHPELATYVTQGITIDVNGNFIWDPAAVAPGGDATNVDLTFTMQVADPVTGATLPGGFGTHDLVFAGKFAPQGGLIQGTDAVFIIDVSGSTSGGFGGDPVGDQNNDGSSDTILDAEIAAFKLLNQQLVDRGLGATAKVAIVSFSSGAASLDMDPVAAGIQLITTPLADVNANGTRDVDEILASLTPGGGTNFEAPLQVAISTLMAAAFTPGNGNVIFLSDGFGSGDFADEVVTIRDGLNMNLRAFGVGPGASLAQLSTIDPDAVTFSNTNELLALFGGGAGGPGAGGTANGFDMLAVYGNSQDFGSFRWLIDTNSDGIINTGDGDIITLQPAQAGFNIAAAIPVAGNFDGIARNGDEIGLYYQGLWLLDTDRDFVVETNGEDTLIATSLLGHPIVGDFDGDDIDDLGVFNANTWRFDLGFDGFGTSYVGSGPYAADAGGGHIDDTHVWGFPGVLDRPVAADMDGDGYDDIGLWVPRNQSQNPLAVAEWFFLISNQVARNGNGGAALVAPGTIDAIDHPYEPVPFGHDLYAEFGNELALPLVGNFDPPAGPVETETSPVVTTTADFNADGQVNGSDFLTWQRNVGRTSATASTGDGNGDSVVNQHDLWVWRETFQSNAAAAAASGVAGDFTGDNMVDGSDFLAWQRHVGRNNATRAMGDATGDGVVNAADLALWQRNLGFAAGLQASHASSAASPLAAAVEANVEAAGDAGLSSLAGVADAAGSAAQPANRGSLRAALPAQHAGGQQLRDAALAQWRRGERPEWADALEDLDDQLLSVDGQEDAIELLFTDEFALELAGMRRQ